MRPADKVFRIITFIASSNEKGTMNWGHYVVVAADAEDAINMARKWFTKDEYVQEVELVAVLTK